MRKPSMLVLTATLAASQLLGAAELLLPPPPPSPPRPAQPSREAFESQVSRQLIYREQVVKAFVRTFPEAFEGPEQSGVLLAWMMMRPDGSVFRSQSMYLPNEQLRRDADIIWQPMHVNGGVSSRETWIRGALLGGGQQFRVDVSLNYETMPADVDESRLDILVSEAVLARHPDMPQIWNDTTVGWLRVVMNEDGTIAREKFETLLTADNTYGGWTKVGPQSYPRFVDQFAELGADPDHLGVMGQMGVLAQPNGLPGQPPIVMGRGEGVSIREIAKERFVLVTYAWPRRPGEPSGGVTGFGMEPTRRTAAPVDPAIALAVVEQYLPHAFKPKSGSSDQQHWILLGQQGDVVQTGVAPTEKGTLITPAGETEPIHSNAYMERIREQVPDVRIGQSHSMMLTNDSGVANVMFVWLTADSPLPKQE